MQLSDYMTKLALTDDQVADAIGRNRVSVSRLRRGVQQPSFETIKRINEFTDGQVSPNDWLEE